jgi:hypothetical protein
VSHDPVAARHVAPTDRASIRRAGFFGSTRGIRVAKGVGRHGWKLFLSPHLHTASFVPLLCSARTLLACPGRYLRLAGVGVVGWRSPGACRRQRSKRFARQPVSSISTPPHLLYLVLHLFLNVFDFILNLIIYFIKIIKTIKLNIIYYIN